MLMVLLFDPYDPLTTGTCEFHPSKRVSVFTATVERGTNHEGLGGGWLCVSVGIACLCV